MSFNLNVITHSLLMDWIAVPIEAEVRISEEAIRFRKLSKLLLIDWSWDFGQE